eukprot:TRINITY_DN8893_c1_g1_i2.p1 TRINITY_DN8893_c1_g1~~TRINITY_DN8893_c1_g1_i2.p1  ORF type:complete len:756 (+),score=217.81 TRINITY_DN8893_c1_g1_i2:78-2345(+)
MSEFLKFVGPLGSTAVTVKELKIKPGAFLSQGTVILLYSADQNDATAKFKSGKMGRIEEVLVKAGDKVTRGDNILKISAECSHPTVMKDMCAECGADLKDDNKPDTSASTASVAMIHSIPELKVSTSEATNLGKEDQKRLLKDRKLVLLVDLDQTLIHTTNDNIPPNIRDVYHFQLYGDRSPWYHTRIRPRTLEFLSNLHSLYEFHICTFGARMYAHKIAAFLDAEGKFFSHRILSRDECFDSRSKTANMSALFPCGDSMVCIIDDREDVWNFAPNLVHVKPYHFFKHTGDINAPPGLSKKENDEKEGVDLDKIVQNKAKDKKTEEKSKANDEDCKKEESEQEKDVEKEESRQEKEEKEDKDSKEKNKEEDKEKDGKDDVADDLELSDDDSDSSSSSSDEDDSKKKENNSEKEKGGKDDLIDIEDSDDYLYYLEEILKTIHKAYYDLYDQMTKNDRVVPDLKTVVPYVKRKVLQGVCLVLSGVVPTQVPVQKSKPFLLARSLGASVEESVSKNTTHLVAARPGTAKVNEAKKLAGIHIVTPDWLWACAERWSRVDESLFKLGSRQAVTMKPPAHCSSPEIAFAERCAEIDISEGYSRQHSVAESDPFLAFSAEDLKGMDKEVDDILSGESDNESSSSDDFDGHGGGGDGGDARGGTRAKRENDEDLGTCIQMRRRSSSESSLDSLSAAEAPRGHKRKADDVRSFDEDEDSNLERPYAKLYRGEEVPSDFEIEDDDVGGNEDWSLMGAELERELGS